MFHVYVPWVPNMVSNVNLLKQEEIPEPLGMLDTIPNSFNQNASLISVW